MNQFHPDVVQHLQDVLVELLLFHGHRVPDPAYLYDDDPDEGQGDQQNDPWEYFFHPNKINRLSSLIFTGHPCFGEFNVPLTAYSSYPVIFAWHSSADSSAKM